MGIAVPATAGGGMEIGDTVTGATATRVLLVGAGPVLADDANLTWDGSTLTIGGAQTLGGQLTWSTGLGAITQILGPSDQPLEIHGSPGKAVNITGVIGPNTGAGPINITDSGGSAGGINITGGPFVDNGIGGGHGGDIAITAGPPAPNVGGRGGNLTIGTANSVGHYANALGALTIQAGAYTHIAGTYRPGGQLTLKTQTGAIAGGAGGTFRNILGPGGSAANTGAIGGPYFVTGGAGGDATGAAGTHTGGKGSTFTFTTGDGGDATGASGTRTGGASGDYVVLFGTPGTGATANGQGGNFGIGTATFDGTAEGNLVIYNGTAPSGGLANAIQLYPATGELHVVDASGNDTTLSPHSADGPAGLYTEEPGIEVVTVSHNRLTGRVVWINQETSTSIVETFDEFNARLGLQPGNEKYLAMQTWDEVAQRRYDAEVKKRIAEAMDEDVEETDLNAAFESVELMESIEEEIDEEYWELDIKEKKTTKKTRKVKRTSQRPTGEFEDTLKAGYRFDEKTGKLMRTKTRPEAETSIELPKKQKMPDWLKKRLQAERIR